MIHAVASKPRVIVLRGLCLSIANKFAVMDYGMPKPSSVNVCFRTDSLRKIDFSVKVKSLSKYFLLGSVENQRDHSVFGAAA